MRVRAAAVVLAATTVVATALGGVLAATRSNGHATMIAAGTPAGAVAMCSAGQLTGRLPLGDGALGTYYVNLVLTNTSPTRCSLRGYARVSFVRGNGRQVGRSAERDTAYRPRSEPVVLAPHGGVAAIRVEISQAGNYSRSACDPVGISGLRVSPPGSTTSLVAAPAYRLQACSRDHVHQLRVTQVLSMSDIR